MMVPNIILLRIDSPSIRKPIIRPEPLSAGIILCRGYPVPAEGLSPLEANFDGQCVSKQVKAND